MLPKINWTRFRHRDTSIAATLIACLLLPQSSGFAESQTQKLRLLKGVPSNGPLSGASPPPAWLDDASKGWTLYFGSGFRGTRSEGPSLDESFGTELGIGAPYALGVDWSLGLGRILERDAQIQFETLLRAFLFRDTSGPYLGFGSTFSEPFSDPLRHNEIFATLGLFGGEGFYLEWDFRGSDVRPVAAIPELGFRLRIDTRKPAPVDSKGPLVRVPYSTAPSLPRTASTTQETTLSESEAQ